MVVVFGSSGPVTGALAGGGGLFLLACSGRRLQACVVPRAMLLVSVWWAAVWWCSVPVGLFLSF